MLEGSGSEASLRTHSRIFHWWKSMKHERLNHRQNDVDHDPRQFLYTNRTRFFVFISFHLLISNIRPLTGCIHYSAISLHRRADSFGNAQYYER